MSPNITPDALRQMASFLGGTGVALGAFGAHALKGTLSKKAGALDNWRTAVSYQLLHAVALLSISTLALDKPKSLREASSNSMASGGKMMFWGTCMFSGSIYLLCLDIGPKRVSWNLLNSSSFPDHDCFSLLMLRVFIFMLEFSDARSNYTHRGAATHFRLDYDWDWKVLTGVTLPHIKMNHLPVLMLNKLKFTFAVLYFTVDKIGPP
ncbi:hypothetical protein ACHAXS_004071 [Conticribra weissflogii]